jgi:hypothetical protein
MLITALARQTAPDAAAPAPEPAGGPGRLDAAQLLPTDQPGLYLKTDAFQAAVAMLQRGFAGLWDAPRALAVHSPGVMSRRDLARSAYVEKFPQFVCNVVPQLADGAGEDGLVTLPSACLCVYPLLERLGEVPEEGFLATVQAPCVRNEDRYAPDRMRAFTMSEYVFFGPSDAARTFRRTMVERISTWLTGLDLDWRLEAANDPFYGRLGEMLIERQRADGLKTEIVLPIGGGGEAACFSVNDHREFFALRWNIQLRGGGLAQSSCVGVGLERLALAMIHRHGADIDRWPA